MDFRATIADVWDVLGAGLISKSRCVCEWGEKNNRNKDCAQWTGQGWRFAFHVTQIISPSYGDFWDLTQESCQHFGNQIEAGGKALCCLLCPCVPSREQCSSEVQLKESTHHLQEKTSCGWQKGRYSGDTSAVSFQSHLTQSSLE